MAARASQRLRYSPNDYIDTPPAVAKMMIEMCNITPEMTVLDPSKGNSAVFYNNLPLCKKDWCEVLENRDFFNSNTKYDLIIGNPPFSKWDNWIKHTMKLTDKFCYIMSCYNLTPARINDIIINGFGITKIHLLKVDWWFSPSYIVIFEKLKQSIITTTPDRVLCEFCNKRCMRGRKGNDPNKCSA